MMLEQQQFVWWVLEWHTLVDSAVTNAIPLVVLLLVILLTEGRESREKIWAEFGYA